MSKKLLVEDFEVFRGPFVSGRQSPDSLGGNLLLSIVLQWFWFFLTQFIGQYSIFPYKDQIFSYLFWSGVALSVLSVAYSIPFIYRKSQRMQYCLVIIVSQSIFGFFPLLMALINLGTAESGLALDQKTLIGFSTTILFIGLLVFLVTILRLAILLHKGHYRHGTKKDTLRRKYEKADYIPGAILAGIGIVYFTIFIFTNIQTEFSTLMIASAICILIFFTMMFVLPEQLLLLYCKFKFKSFNFNKRGYLFSEKD